MSDQELCIEIAKVVKEAGGRVFYVGGCVRDKFLNLENKDLDIEIHGITPEKMIELLSTIDDPISYGSSFGIFAIPGYHVDIGMPRRERNTGNGHRDFTIDMDPFMGYENAARRRDFTINALMEDVLTGEVLDYFGGIEDIQNKKIRCVDPETFIEDPLRVLRGCQFASRFDFEIDEETINLCKTVDITNLSKERVEEETKKALIRSKKPSVYFESLRKMNQLSYWYKEIEDLIEVPQDPTYHPEGNVFNHTMEVIDRAVEYQDKVSNPYFYELSCLTHDFGKTITTTYENGHIHSYGHEVQGLPIIKTFIRRLTTNKELSRYISNMVVLHMRPLQLSRSKSSIKATNNMFDKAFYPEDLIYLCMADSGLDENDENIIFLKERYEIYKEYMARPYVTGDDLIEAGLNPDEDFSKLLDFSHRLRLSGVNKDAALKQILAYKKQIDKTKETS